MLKAIVLDFNGVMIDDEPVHYRLIRDLVRPYGIDLDEKAYFTQYIAFSDAEAFEHVLRDAGYLPSMEEIARLVEEKRRRYRTEALADIRVYPGVQAFVETAAAAYPLAIASGAAREEIHTILQTLGLLEAFAVIVSADDVVRGKPAADIYLEAVRRLQAHVSHLKPSEVLAIEDTPGGIQAARAAGLRVAAVPHTCPPESLREADIILVDGLVRFPWVQVHLLFEQTDVDSEQ